MSRYESRQEIATKADYEGGVLELVFGYGLFPEDLPEGDDELRDALVALRNCEPIIDHFISLLPEPNYDEDDE